VKTPRWTTSNVLKTALGVAAIGAAIGLVALIPALMGMSWTAIADVLAGVSISSLIALSVLWIAGLLAHTVVLTAALPGLSNRRALLLNLSGSAVSNVLPFGGAAGMGLGYAMARTWRVSPTSFASFTAISNLWNVVGKLVVGSALLSGALLVGLELPPALHGILVVGAGSVLVVVLAAAAVLTNKWLANAVGTGLNRATNGVLALFGSNRRVDMEAWILEARGATSTTVAAGWARLTFGVLAYMLLQALLLAACLVAVGAHVPVLVIAAAFGVERLLTVVPFTPGGSGLAELGSVAVLVGLGVDPVSATAGVLLYRLFTFLLEIPVGGLSTLVWFRLQRSNQSVAV